MTRHDDRNTTRISAGSSSPARGSLAEPAAFAIGKTLSRWFSGHRVSRRARARRDRGVTLIEMVAATAIVAIMATVAVPTVQTTVKKHKEIELRRSLRLMRTAIDDYKRIIGENPQYKAVIKKTGAEDYPPDLETLVNGFDTGEAKERKLKFLRRIPMDPMTGDTDWVLRSSTQERDADFWDHAHVFDVRTRSRAVALDGTRYSEW